MVQSTLSVSCDVRAMFIGDFLHFWRTWMIPLEDEPGFIMEAITLGEEIRHLR